MCQVIGISTHFLWLWMFVWTLICTFHAFTVFRSIRVVSLVSSNEELCMLTKRVVFSLAVPASIVTTVVVSSLATSGYTTIIYGNGRCYLDSPFLIMVSMVGPLAIIVLCNVGLSVPTLITIYTIRAMMVDRYNRVNDLYMYIKLSTSTGAFWTVAVLCCSQITGRDVLRYISIVLNGLQGVAIFTSCVANRRVILLYYKRVLQRKENMTSVSN
ncbi:putative adhesion G protein-coupled receptor E4P [Physella acuta]|uniref:putative adhesion G protein-coupled receptor E4P n=1 Tax=Physella acuta TaxID=109671 RepID=UPI0027DB91E5|nr:putative adhesion G protein-coupled receptor E4P [Physella acuta]